MKLRRRSFRGSVFLKILVVLLLAAGLIHWLMGRALRQAHETEQRYRGAYVRELVGDVVGRLGDPPDSNVGRKLAASGLWRIRYDAKNSGTDSWATEASLPTFSVLKDHLIGEDWGLYDNAYFFLRESPSGTLVLLSHPHRNESLGPGLTVAVVSGMLLVLAAVWLALEWLLKPLRWLDEGLSRVAAGDLSHRIRHRGNDELGRLTDQFNAMTAEVQEMLEQRRQLLLDVSHELRTPLTRLRLGLETLPEGEERDSLTEDVRELEAMVQELLEGARLAHGRSQLQWESLDLAELIRDVAAAYAQREPGLTLEVPKRLEIQGDRVRLQRLVQNLLANAFSHGLPARGPVAVRLSASAEMVELNVQDQGPGLTSDQLKRLFVPFFRSDASRARVRGGVGLGLALCRGVARAHGGSLEAAHAPGGGLVFTLTLPRVYSGETSEFHGR